MTSFGGPSGFTPAYLQMDREDLRSRAARGLESLSSCRLCPRDCGVNRLEDRWSACKTGRYAVVSSAFPHSGDEDCLRGWNGSGTIFFSHCNLRCVFCQNFEISQGVRPGTPGMLPHVLADLMLSLQRHGCHNINLVTPEHVVPQILEALVPAVEQGLRLPLVYNTSAYDSLETLAILDGIVDIYMPDLKFFTAEASSKFLTAADFPEVSQSDDMEMHRHVWHLSVDDLGISLRGVLILKLVMTGMP